MATTKGIILPSKNQNLVSNGAPKTLQGMLSSESVKNRFNELLGKKSAGFVTSLLSVVNNNKLLEKAKPETVISAAAQAAALDLPINQSLGYAYIVPYGNEAQFQIGYKGLIQLAMRSGQYKTINAAEVYEGEIKNVNRFTGEFEFGEKESDVVVGYMAYFRLANGFEKYLYMTMDEMQAHARKYSKAYKGGTTSWGITDFHSMAIKTVLKRLISKFGIMSVEMQSMQSAMTYDGAVLREDKEGYVEPDYVDTVDVDGTTVDTETGEIISEENKEASTIDGVDMFSGEKVDKK